MSKISLKKSNKQTKLDFTIPKHISVKEKIRKRLSTPTLPVSFEVPKDYKGKDNLETQDWEVMIDGSAYFGQFKKLEEIREGFGKQVETNGCFVYGLFEEDKFVEGIVVSHEGYIYKGDFRTISDPKSSPKATPHQTCSYLDLQSNSIYGMEGNRYCCQLKDGAPEGEGTYHIEDPAGAQFGNLPHIKKIKCRFEKGLPRGLAWLYTIKYDQENGVAGVPSSDDQGEDEINPDNSAFKLVAKCVLDGFDVARYLKVFMHGRTIFMDTEDYKEQYFGVMYDYLNRHIDYVGTIKKGDDTFGYGLTGSFDCLMYSRNLEDCYEGPAYHYSIAASQFSVIDWPLGNDVDKVGHGRCLLEVYGIMLEASWDNEDSRLIRITGVYTRDGGCYKSKDFTYLLDDHKCSKAQIDTEKYPFRDKFIINHDKNPNSASNDFQFYIYADRERTDHQLVNSVSLVKFEVDAEGKRTGNQYGKIYMGRAYNEGPVHMKNPEEEAITLHGDRCRYEEESLNFYFDGEIRSDKLVNGEITGSYCKIKGEFDDDNLTEGEIRMTYVDGFEFEGHVHNYCVNGPGKLTLPSGEVLERDWRDGVMLPERSFMITSGDSKLRTIRCVLVEVTDPEKNPIPDIKYDDTLKELTYDKYEIILKDAIIRSSSYIGVKYNGQVTLRSPEERSGCNQMKIWGILGSLEKRSFHRGMMYSDQLHSVNYYGKQYLNKILFRTQYCDWSSEGAFSPDSKQYTKTKIDFFGFIEATIWYQDQRICKVERVEFEVKSGLKRLINRYYGAGGADQGTQYNKILEGLRSDETGEVEFSYIDAGYWDQRLTLYLPFLDETTKNELPAYLCKRSYKREAVTFHSLGYISIGSTRDYFLQGGGLRVHLADFVDTEEGEFFGDHCLKTAKIVYKNGSVYTGEVKFCKRNGHGTIKHSNGEVYEGEWFGGLMDGHGVYKWPNGDSYEGEFRLNMMWGSGGLTLSSGVRIEGEFLKGLPCEGKFNVFDSGSGEQLDDEELRERGLA